MVVGVFVSLYSATVLPWLADTSPSLVDTIEDDTRLIVAFIAGLAAEFVGTILLAIAFLRGGVRPRWAGFVLLASALMTVVGSLMAPNGPASDLTINLLSNLGPVLFLIVLGDRGCQMWFARVPAEHELGRPVGYPAPR
jgi:hypothetical protein